MRRLFLTLIIASIWMPITVIGQTYNSLWKSVEEAQEKDLPKTAMAYLQKLTDKAQQEQAYGQLLKSTLLLTKLQAEVAPDSLRPAVSRLEQREQNTKDLALKAVYDVVLANIYGSNSELADDWAAIRDGYRRQAMEHPEVLAQVKGDDYKPFVIKQADSKIFGHDLLSIVGMELGEWQWLADYYEKAGNRQAACLAAGNAVSNITSIDSLINIYGDLEEAGELAIKRYQLMTDERFTISDKNSWLEESLKRWGKWMGANWLRNELNALNNPCYQVHIGQKVCEVGKPQTVQLHQLRHLDSLTMKVYRTRLSGDTKLQPWIDADFQQIKNGMTELKEHARTLTFSGHATYDVFEDSLQLSALPAGVYLLEFTTSPQTEVSRMLYFVSGIRLLHQALPDNNTRYVVVNATTGEPVSGATLRLSFQKRAGHAADTMLLACNKQGELIYNHKDRSPSGIFVYTSKDRSLPTMSSYGRYTYYHTQYFQEHVQLMTDRSIYRPGQKVHVAAIAWKEISALDNTALEGKTLTLTLRDANYKEVAQQTVTTDRYGKCAAVFTLPQRQLNGTFTIQTKGASATFRVEEYKRPTFQVAFADYKASYKSGDTIQVEGKALTYAGIPVQEGIVKYTVKRRVAFWWLAYSSYWQRSYAGRGLQDEVLGSGETMTEDDGSFRVNVPMVLPNDLGRSTMFYHFVVEADITDTAGETHQGTLTLPLGNKATVLTCNLPSQVRNDQLPQITFSRRNAAGNDISGTIAYRIDGKKWQTCEANAPLTSSPSPLANLKSGDHRLEAVCEQDTIDMNFVVFGLDDKKPATQTHDWFYVSDKEFSDNGQPVTVQVGSSDDDLYIFYSIFAGDQQLESGVIKKDGSLENRKFTYQNDYGNGLLVSYAWVKNGQCYRHEQFIRRPMPDKHLKLSWETFRDRLTPGQQEEWRLKVVNPDGTAADASMMAVLYDKSLDAIKQHKWSFAPVNHLSQPSTSWQWRSWESIGASGAQKIKLLSSPTLAFSEFDKSVFPVYLYSLRFRPNRRLMVRGSHAIGNGEVLMAKSTAATYDAVEAAPNVAATEDESIVVGYGGQQGNDATVHEEQVQLRENLSETAFCYPTLTTDKEGVVTLKFTLPESLTTWRFMGIANTTDMLYGSIEGEAVAQKDVMIQPNMPRFIRMGDDAGITARLFNTTDHAIKGTARIQLIDPTTDKMVYEQAQDVNIEASSTGAVKFNVQSASFKESLLICKVTVKGDGFSDGEQHYLPILPDCEMVTQTIPYTQHQAGVKAIDLKALFPQGTTQQKLTIEYTNNPAWLMVQALPIVGQPCEHNAIDQAASYYSNLLAKSLLNKSPQVKRVFDLWKQEELTSNPSSLASNLLKNEELKDLLLAETPWVYAAERESEQKQRLADFFDENDINNRLSTAIEKLQKLQNADGSFSWYPGMDGNTYITVTVEEMLARLRSMTTPSKSVATLYENAFKFMSKEMIHLVAEMKKAEKKGYRQTFPSFTALRWLYLCAIDGRQLSGDVKTANNYLIGLLKKETKRQTIYEKALTAVVLTQRGEKTKAAEYVKSLKEYTVYTEEMGRYYDTRRATYSWYDYKIPTEVAAIEAIQRVTPNDQQTIDEMRRWLLQEKRTQAWDTPINSVNAIYAFLHATPHAQTQLTTNQPATILAIDGSPIETSSATAGIGYVKAVINQPEGQKFTATKSSEGTSWGAVYAQFLQKSNEVEATQSGISVKREILTSNHSPLTSLKVGDRIRIRITIDTTRDLDFVQVIDRRAACLEPINQLSGYQDGAYASPKDYATQYFFTKLSKGRHMIETEYYLDRAGQYETGTCTVGCSYAPEYRATAPSMTIKVHE